MGLGQRRVQTSPRHTIYSEKASPKFGSVEIGDFLVHTVQLNFPDRYCVFQTIMSQKQAMYHPINVLNNMHILGWVQ